VRLHREHLTDVELAAIKRELRGRDLACWCPLDEPCHADTLLEIANEDPPRGKNQLEGWLRGRAEKFNPGAAVLIDEIKAGDERALGTLAFILSQQENAQLVRWPYMAKAPLPIFQEALRNRWTLNHHELCKAAGSIVRLFDWFKAAAFEVPDFPDPLTVYRGTTGIDAKLAGEGVSWTLDKRIAAWFACTYRHQGSPLVLRREVPVRDILLYDDGRNEQEVVTFSSWLPTVVDGDPEEWRELADEYQKPWVPFALAA
jgi:hypothetical protein